MKAARPMLSCSLYNAAHKTANVEVDAGIFVFNKDKNPDLYFCRFQFKHTLYSISVDWCGKICKTARWDIFFYASAAPKYTQFKSSPSANCPPEAPALGALFKTTRVKTLYILNYSNSDPCWQTSAASLPFPTTSSSLSLSLSLQMRTERFVFPEGGHNLGPVLWADTRGQGKGGGGWIAGSVYPNWLSD